MPVAVVKQGYRLLEPNVYFLSISRHAIYKFCLPSANGMELIELGGMTPTSVTTAVILVGGVKS